MTDAEPKKILLTVSNGFIAFDLENGLRTAGYAVIGPASDAAQALQLLSDTAPDAAFITLGSADKGFLELLEALHHLGVPFALTAPSITDSQLAELGAHGLSAPFTDDALQAITRIMTQ